MFGFLEVSETVEDILARSLEGKRLSTDEAETLFKATGDDFLALGLVADRVRKEKAGDAVSYVINRNINFTNVCTGS
ncbi:MAG: 7,8-didemethyl-8-hydroxy-5-deazariboflavin synthase subunit CofH, partial [Euryarchaeota archaeon]|nr:7,8-didemethyl-8-hydroxy-5-deazariboflavin synthase subunit CofH [Euryarchaeota archaeon]